MKKVHIFVLTLVILVAAGLGYWQSRTPKEIVLITEKQVNVSAETRAAAEKRIEARKQDLEKVSQENTVERFNLYIQLALDQRLLGHLGEAKVAFEEAMKLDANATTTIFGYSMLMADMGDLDTSREYAEKAIAKDNANIDYWRWRIELEEYFVKPKPAVVEALYKRAIEHTKSDPNIRSIYAQFLEKQNKLEESRDQWRQLTDLFPTQQQFKDELARLDAQIQTK